MFRMADQIRSNTSTEYYAALVDLASSCKRVLSLSNGTKPARPGSQHKGIAFWCIVDPEQGRQDHGGTSYFLAGFGSPGQIAWL